MTVNISLKLEIEKYIQQKMNGSSIIFIWHMSLKIIPLKIAKIYFYIYFKFLNKLLSPYH